MWNNCDVVIYQLYVLLDEVSVQVFPPIFNWMICLLTVELCEFFIWSRFKSSIGYALANIVYQSVACLFLLLTVLPMEWKLFTFNEIRFVFKVQVFLLCIMFLVLCVRFFFTYSQHIKFFFQFFFKNSYHFFHLHM